MIRILMLLVATLSFVQAEDGGMTGLWDEMWAAKLGATTDEMLAALGRPDDSGVVEAHEILGPMVWRLGEAHRQRPLTRTETGLSALWCIDGLIHADGLAGSALSLILREDRETILATASGAGLALTTAWIQELQALVPPFPAGPADEEPAAAEERWEAHLRAHPALDEAAIARFEARWTDGREDGFDDLLLAWVRRHAAEIRMPVKPTR